MVKKRDPRMSNNSNALKGIVTHCSDNNHPFGFSLCISLLLHFTPKETEL